MSTALTDYLHSFRPLTEEERDLIKAAFPLRTVEEGATLHQPGRICREMYFISLINTLSF